MHSSGLYFWMNETSSLRGSCAEIQSTEKNIQNCGCNCLAHSSEWWLRYIIWILRWTYSPPKHCAIVAERISCTSDIILVTWKSNQLNEIFGRTHETRFDCRLLLMLEMRFRSFQMIGECSTVCMIIFIHFCFCCCWK